MRYGYPIPVPKKVRKIQTQKNESQIFAPMRNKGISTSGQSDIEFLEDPLCPELSHLKSESVPSAISRWLKTVTLSAPNFKDAEGNAMYEIPAGVTGRLMSE